MFNRLMVVAVAALLAAAGPVSFAKGGGGGHAGGTSAEHMSNQGMANTNGPESGDRDKGLQRAEDRMSDQGMAHEKANQAHSKHKPGKTTRAPDRN